MAPDDWLLLGSCLAQQFFQKKKEKKRKPYPLVEGFRKASFSGKILPEGVEIFSETRRA